MKYGKRIISIALSLILVFTMIGILPEKVSAADDKSVTVYFTLSENGTFVTGNDAESTVLARVPVEIEYFDLADYGLEEFYRYETASSEDGGEYIGTEVIEQPTLLHLYIRMLEKYYLGYENGEMLQTGGDALTIEGSRTSMYMKKFWGHDENLMYFVDHSYPLMTEGWGATADYILLEDGMEIDVAMFSDWNFYQYGAFAAFSPSSLSVNTGEEFSLTMEGTSTMKDADPVPMVGETVVYAQAEDIYGGNSNDNWQVWEKSVTDDKGEITMSFSEPGTYYISSTPVYITFPGESGEPCVAPPIAAINVEGEGTAEDNTGTENIKVLSDISFASDNGSSSLDYEMSPDFKPEVEEYNVYVPDGMKTIAFKAEASPEASAVSAKIKLSAEYTGTDGSSHIVEKTSSLTVNLPGLIGKGEQGASLRITASCGLSSQSYAVKIIRTPSIEMIELLDEGGSSVELNPSFSGGNKVYSAIVPDGTKEMTVKAVPTDEAYSVRINGTECKEKIIELTGNSTPDNIRVEVTGTGGEATSYEITVNKRKWIRITFINVSEGTTIQVVDKNQDDVLRTKTEDCENVSAERLLEGETYTYRISKKGFRTKTAAIEAGTEDITVDATLQEVETNSQIDISIESVWPSFRGNDENNGVCVWGIPNKSSDAVMMWAVKNGGGWSGAPSSPIIVDGDIVFTTNSEIVKVDRVTGEVVQRGDMVAKSVFSLIPPTYADGMIFVSLGGGRVQAFNADTLESLWVYQDALGGQPNSPLTYRDGYVYTGFWNNDDKDADVVCISAADEDVDNKVEEKSAVWTYKHKGGFYWAGAYASDSAVVIGAENGSEDDEQQTGVLFAFDPETGEIIDKIDNLNGDIRSTIVYDSSTERCCFTSAGGEFYTVKLNKDGSFDKGNLNSVKLYASGTSEGKAGRSTSTPVISDGRAYIGVSGSAQLGEYSGHNITVIDLAKNEIAYKVETRGFPQASGMLTTAYKHKDGYNYIYFIENFTPGIIRVLKDKAGQTEPLLDIEENGGILGEANHSMYADTLLTPRGEQAEYCVASPIADEYGTIYFKNDSSYIMAVGSRITELKIVQKPDKVNYDAGEVFDPSGMVVMAKLANGLERDVTEYISYSKEPLEEGDLEVEISFDHIMYNDKNKTMNPVTAYVDIECISEGQRKLIENVKNLISQIPENAETDEEWVAMEAAVSEARDEYDALTYSSRKFVSNKDVLVSAETAVAKHKLEAGSSTKESKINAVSYKSLSVEWSINSNADGYEIYRSEKSGELGVKIKTVNSRDTVRFTNDVTTGKTYYYTVRPFILVDGAPAGSVYSKQMSGKAVLSTPVLKAASASYSSIKLTWGKVEGASGYVIYRSKSKYGNYTAIKTLAGGAYTSYTNTGLTTGTGYYYKIKAYRGSYYSTASAAASAVPTLSKPPTPSVSKASSGYVKVKWKGISGETGYQIYRAKSKNGKYTKVKSVKMASSKYPYAKIKAAKKKTYYYKVRAYKKVGSKTVYSQFSKVKAYKLK